MPRQYTIFQRPELLIKVSNSDPDKAKQKVQELYEPAIEARQQTDALFESRKISVEEFQKIEEGLKIIKEFAQANLRYKEALPESENARLLIDKALEPPELL